MKTSIALLTLVAPLLVSPIALLAADAPLQSTLAQLKPAAANVPYADPADSRQKLDIYAPEGAKNLPAVFWIHGGGWQAGDKTGVQLKPQAFVDKGFVFVSTDYRLLPSVDMVTIFRDVAKSLGWVHANIAKHGGVAFVARSIDDVDRHLFDPAHGKAWAERMTT